MRPRALEIEFRPELVDDLGRRIDAVRWPEAARALNPDGAAGLDHVVLRGLVDYWRDAYDWSAVQRELNQLDHRDVRIDGERIHAVVYPARPEPSSAVLVLHGWPGSFVEFLDAAPLLSSAGYDVVVPSLPGFALSDAPARPGMHGGRMAERLHALMAALGHDRYAVQGGDWGAVVALALASRHPEAVAAVHLNLIPDAPRPHDGEEVSEEEARWWEFRRAWNRDERAYYAVQATKPHTLSYGLTDSPVGLLAWMLEKFWAWTDHDGDLWSVLDRDRVLTNVMLYWLPNRVLSSSRIYFEMEHPDQPLIPSRVEAPVGYLRMPKEMFAPPRQVAERFLDVVHYTEALRGGHFAAMEQPRLWADDVAMFLARVLGT